MVHLKPRRHPEQQPLLAACATSRPAPAERPRGIDPQRTPLPLGAPARSVAALRELRAEAPVEPRTLGMRRPAPPKPPVRPPSRPRPVNPPLMADEVEDVALIAGLNVALAHRALDDLERIAAELLAELAPVVAKAEVA